MMLVSNETKIRSLGKEQTIAFELMITNSVQIRLALVTRFKIHVRPK